MAGADKTEQINTKGRDRSKVSRNPVTLNQSRDTGMAMVLICLLLLLGGPRTWLLGLAIVLLVITMTLPQLFAPLARLWLGLAHVVGTAVSLVLLTLIFHLVVTPVAIIRRLTGADPLQLKQWRRTPASAFTEKEHTYSAADLERPY